MEKKQWVGHLNPTQDVPPPPRKKREIKTWWLLFGTGYQNCTDITY